MRMVNAEALLSWTRLKESRNLDTSEYVEYSDAAGVPPSHKLVFVSHRWITSTHPDPGGEQLAELQQRLISLADSDCGLASMLVFYDYCSLPQRPRTPDEESGFYRDLGALEALSRLAHRFIILSEGYRDYLNRAWCFFEAITARGNVHFFSDQNHVKEELECREFLMTEDLPQITSYDLDYKLDASETEILVAVFQHLSSCRVTQQEDAPIIKNQLIAHYNRRRLTSFGKLVVAVVKHFGVEFAMMPVGGDGEVYVCRPFFEDPTWTRLPSLETHPRFMGGRPGPSLFALPREACEDIGRRHTRGFRPLLRLSLPNVQNVQDYLAEFQKDPDWERHVVRPTMIGEQGDCFPAVDNVIHTILERPPGFFCSNDRRYLYFFLTGR